MLRTGLRCGLSIDETWSLTPAELALVEEAAVARAKDAHRLAWTSGWAAEYCARQERLRGPGVEYDELFGAAAPKQDMTLTAEQTAQFLREWATAMSEVPR